MTWMLPGWLALGGLLGLSFVLFARRHGEARELRTLAVGLTVAALVYVVAAMIGRSTEGLAIEAAGLVAFTAVAVIGARRWPILLAGGWAVHVIWDAGLHLAAARSYIGLWYPTLCTSFDSLVAGYVAWRVGAGSFGQKAV